MASMIRIWSFFFVLSVFGLLFASETKKAQSKEFVLTLDNSNFHETVGKHDFIVVEFYAPWCVYSKELAPEYEKAAAILSRHHPPIILAKVDCNEKKNKGLASEFKIRGFPTIMILRNGAYGRKTIQEYIGPRDADSIVAFLTKQSGPAFREIKFVAYD